MSKIEITAVDTSTLPKVGAAECDELLKAVKNGDKEARDKFITANLRLVLSVCKRFRRDGVSQDDLFQIGAVGLIKALNNFDVSQNVKFSTYAVPMIIGEIRRALRDVSGIKVTRSVRDTAYKALKAKEKLTSEGQDNEPSLVEISAEIGIPISEIACALDAVSDTVSYFEPAFGDDGGLTVMDKLTDEKQSEDNWLENLALRGAVQRIPKKEKQILFMRYYLGKTQAEISKAAGISQAQVSRIEKSAIDKLKSYM